MNLRWRRVAQLPDRDSGDAMARRHGIARGATGNPPNPSASATHTRSQILGPTGAPRDRPGSERPRQAPGGWCAPTTTYMDLNWQHCTVGDVCRRAHTTCSHCGPPPKASPSSLFRNLSACGDLQFPLPSPLTTSFRELGLPMAVELPNSNATDGPHRPNWRRRLPKWQGS